MVTYRTAHHAVRAGLDQNLIKICDNGPKMMSKSCGYVGAALERQRHKVMGERLALAVDLWVGNVGGKCAPNCQTRKEKKDR